MKNFINQNYNEIILLGLILVTLSPVVSLLNDGVAEFILVSGVISIVAGVVALAKDKE